LINQARDQSDTRTDLSRRINGLESGDPTFRPHI